MPRYYFNVRRGDLIVPDPEGLELTSIENAWAEAAGSIADLVKDVYLRNADNEVRPRMAIEVSDDNGPMLIVGVDLLPKGNRV